eukprot:Skav229031  [mRNA]  locus=scaffold127:746686:750001:- [translate_table: standard]
MMGLAKRVKARILQASTSEIYGDPEACATEITIYGDGSQTRSFGYVDDTVDGLIRLMNQDKTIGPVNIGNPNEFTVKDRVAQELAEMVVELTGSKSKIVYLPLPGDDPKQRRPDIKRAKELLDWQPKVELREGLKKTIEYFKAISDGVACATLSTVQYTTP